MSLEAALAEHTTALSANTAALTRTAENQERLIAGQQAALDKIDAGKPPKAAAGKPKDATVAGAPAGGPAPADVVAAATDNVATMLAGGVTDADLKTAAVAWMDGKSKEERGEAAKRINETLAWMGFATGAKLTGPDATLTPDQRKQAKFFIERWASDLSVDFSADYDFDGPVDQGSEVEADPFG